MTDTSKPTAEDFEIASRVARFDDHPGLADVWQTCAEVVRAGAARAELAEKLAREFHKGVLSVRDMVEFDQLDQDYRDGLTAGARAALECLAAEGRLLPEGGTEEAAQTCEEMCEDNHDGLVCTRLAGHSGRHVAHNEEDRPLASWTTAPAAPIPDDRVHNHGPAEGRGLDCPEQLVDGRLRGACMDTASDGTPEKLWPTWQNATHLVIDTRRITAFEARYPGQCEACGDRFDEGDEIGYAPGFDRPLCRGCLADPERATRRELAKTPCTECWLVHEGECL